MRAPSPYHLITISVGTSIFRYGYYWAGPTARFHRSSDSAGRRPIEAPSAPVRRRCETRPSRAADRAYRRGSAIGEATTRRSGERIADAADFALEGDAGRNWFAAQQLAAGLGRHRIGAGTGTDEQHG